MTKNCLNVNNIINVLQQLSFGVVVDFITIEL